MKLNNKTFSFLALLVSIIIFLIFSEIFIRITFRYKPTEIKDVSNLLILGESTSAPSNNGSDWPAQLQTILSEHNMNLNVVNVAKSATTTNRIIENIDDYIYEYKPVLIISMMGINDYSKFWPKEWLVDDSGNFFLRLKIVRLITYLYIYIKSNFKHTADFVPDNLEFSNLNLPQTSEIEKKINSCNEKKTFCTDTFNLISDLLKNKTSLEKSKYYSHLAFYTQEDNLKKPFLKNTTHLYYLSSKWDSRVNESTNFALHFAISSNQYNLCREIVDFAIRDNIEMNDTFLLRVATYLESDIDFVNKIFEHSGKNYVFRPESRHTPTQSNYKLLKEKVLKLNICWIAMEYPNRDFAYYFKIFDESARPDLFFKIENKSNFQKELKHHSYETLFTDKFGKTFGHTTYQGSRLIAINVFELIMQLKQQSKCRLDNQLE